MISRNEFEESLDSLSSNFVNDSDFAICCAYIEQQLKKHSFSTALGVARIIEVDVGARHSNPVQFDANVTIELPRLDKTFHLPKCSGHPENFIKSLERVAKKWASIEAQNMIRNEDEASDILEIRRHKKFTAGDPRHLFVYRDGCLCAHCRDRSIAESPLSELLDGESKPFDVYDSSISDGLGVG